MVFLPIDRRRVRVSVRVRVDSVSVFECGSARARVAGVMSGCILANQPENSLFKAKHLLLVRLCDCTSPLDCLCFISEKERRIAFDRGSFTLKELLENDIRIAEKGYLNKRNVQINQSKQDNLVFQNIFLKRANRLIICNSLFRSKFRF